MDHRPSSKPWSEPVVAADIPDAGSHYDLVADASVREAIARLAGLRALSQLRAVFDLRRQGEDIAVQGEVIARVGQTCVVTLEPIESDVRETVDLIFSPPGRDAVEGKRTRKKREPPERLENGVIDLGGIATEFLILGLDPYPRKPGVEFGLMQAGDGRAHPFAGLAALKKR